MSGRVAGQSLTDTIRPYTSGMGYPLNQPRPGALTGVCGRCRGPIFRNPDPDSPALPAGRWHHELENCDQGPRVWAATAALLFGVVLTADESWWRFLGMLMLLFPGPLLYDACVKTIRAYSYRLEL